MATETFIDDVMTIHHSSYELKTKRKEQEIWSH